jgi:glycosyltransferase involved in cell wall biosynthesis
MPRILFVVTADLDARLPAGGPRKDYTALAEGLGADMLDRTAARSHRFGRLIARSMGIAMAQAVVAFARRRQYDAVLTDGEHIGIPLAVLLKITRDRMPHVTIGHRITASKKRPFFKYLHVQTHINRIALHAQRQYDLAVDELGLAPDKVALIPYQADTEFWRPQPDIAEERLICSAGLEFRDYPTLVQAVEGLDVKVVIGAASHWSKRANTAAESEAPANVEVDRFDYAALRRLYARSAIVVVPLDDVDFQAGVTTILEAMAMGKAVIVTHSLGQTDIVEDRRTTTRGAHPRKRPEGMLRRVAEATGLEIEPNGFYVPPNDPGALRRAIEYLLDHPEERARLGAAGRRIVERVATLERYVERLSELVDQAVLETSNRHPVGCHPEERGDCHSEPSLRGEESRARLPHEILRRASSG